MESPQSVVSPLKSYPLPEKHNLDHFARFESKKPDPSLGVLEVYIHQARDIQNICIYHKQDVYAKIYLTTDPEKSVTTKTVNGGGKNPVFNENLCIDIPSIDSSLKCEIFMLSRVRNYLQDQLLGFALIPLSEVIFENGKLEKEFTLSCDDIFHSHSGFVQLTLAYRGVSPEVMAVPPPLPPVAAAKTAPELDKLEFPDPRIVNENEKMVSEYIGMSSESLSFVSSDTDDQTSSENGACFGFENPKPDSPHTSVSTNESQCAKSEDKDKPVDGGSGSGSGSVGDSVNRGLVNLEPDQKVVQQDFVDLYMKSMQQFTDSLAKMKLPLETENEQTSSGNSSSDKNGNGNTSTPDGARTRVFYGSRAFF